MEASFLALLLSNLVSIVVNSNAFCLSNYFGY